MKIEIENLSFSHKKIQILKGIDLVFGDHSIYCLLGLNGAGKSTFLRCLMGFEKFNGTIKINGLNLWEYSCRDLAKQCAYIGQKPTLSFAFKVMDIVMMGRTSCMGFLANPSQQDYQKVLESLELLSITHLKDRLYTQLSGGEAQLVMLASALAQEPQLLILDEPTAYLDFVHTHLFLNLVKKLSKKGIKILMSTHSPHHALILSSEVFVLQNGKIAFQGEAQNVLSANNLKSIYGIDVEIKKIGETFVSYCKD